MSSDVLECEQPTSLSAFCDEVLKNLEQEPNFSVSKVVFPSLEPVELKIFECFIVREIKKFFKRYSVYPICNVSVHETYSNRDQIISVQVTAEFKI